MRPTSQPNAPNGLGGFSAWPTQAGAFRANETVLARERSERVTRKPTKQVQPTECPSRLERSFPPGSAEPGHFFIAHCSRARARCAGRWSQKDAPLAWVDSPPLICPSRGVSGRAIGRRVRVECQGLGCQFDSRRIGELPTPPYSTIDSQPPQ